MRLRISKKGLDKAEVYRVILDNIRYFGKISIYEIRETEDALVVEFECFEHKSWIERAAQRAKTFGICINPPWVWGYYHER